MLRSALILSAGLLAALCFACVAVVAPPPPPPPPAPVASGAVRMVGPAATGPTCRSGDPLFINHVVVLQNGWNPDPMNPADPPPLGVGTSVANTVFAAALLNAFQLAPPNFQDRLCKLNTIFINGPACVDLASCMLNSWGYRAIRDGSTHIAISAGLWGLSCADSTEANPYPYHCFESDLLAGLLKQLNWDPMAGAPSPPRYAAPTAPVMSGGDAFDMTILAALAHEVGHVRWYEVMNPNPNNRGGIYNPNLFCGGAFFVNSWKTPIRRIPPVWRGFGEWDRNNSHFRAPQISTIFADIMGQDWAAAATDLDGLYHARQPWASFFGALSPDEDFVETYKLYVLTNAQSSVIANEGPLTSLPITFVAGATEDIPTDYGIADPTNSGVPSITKKSLLANKGLCIASFI